MNKKGKSVIAVFAIIAVVYAFIFLVIPFEKIAASWVSFAFTLISLLVTLGISVMAFKGKEELVSKVYGFPILRIGYIYAITQFVMGLGFTIAAAFLEVPVWIPLVFSVLLLGMALIGFIATDTTRDVIEETENKTERITKATKLFKLDVDGVVDAAKGTEFEKDVTKLAEDIRYSDPVSCEEAEDVENKLFTEIGALKAIADSGDTEKVKEQVTKVKNLLSERNRLCKAYKK